MKNIEQKLADFKAELQKEQDKRFEEFKTKVMNTPDEIRYERFRDNNPHLFIEPKTEVCDCCLTQQEDVRLSPDEYGFTCVECIGKTFESSRAVNRYLDSTNHTREELSDWWNGLKI